MGEWRYSCIYSYLLHLVGVRVQLHPLDTYPAERNPWYSQPQSCLGAVEVR
jgi:hypothetical protein